MSGTAYRLLGFFVWRALKWYLREKLPPPRKVVTVSALALGALVATAALLRRSVGEGP